MTHENDRKMRNYYKLFGVSVIGIIICIIICLLTSCSTIREHESYTEHHRIESMMAKMDSVMNKSQTVVQDTSWHETFIQKLESIKERNDTSHTIVVDSTGKVIKETITIIREREVSSESDRLEREGMKHSIEKMDSTISVQNKQISKMDSLLRESTKEKVIEKDSPWYKKIWDGIELILIGIVIGFIFVIITYRYWKNFLPRR